MRFDEVTQRIVGIRRTLAPHLHVERTEEGIAFHGKLHETQAVRSRCHLPSGLVRRLRRGNEDHLGERQFLPCRLRDDKMPEMDGIERAAHDADALLLLCHDLPPLPMRQPNAADSAKAPFVNQPKRKNAKASAAAMLRKMTKTTRTAS